MGSAIAFGAFVLFGLTLAALAAFPKYRKIALNPYVLIIGLGLLLRLFAATRPMGYFNDISAFKSWAGLLAEHGFSAFYVSEAYTDYPPGYMYILYVLGWIRQFFSLAYDGYFFTLLIKTPAIVADLLAAVFIYKISAHYLRAKTGLLLALAYALNPAIIFDSSVWGQVDAVYTLPVLVSIWFLAHKRYLGSFGWYALAVLIKPQALIFGPLYLFTVFHILASQHFQWPAWKTLLKCAGVSLLVLMAGILPFTSPWLDFTPVIKQYAATISSYPYAVLNAFNLYALTGANWRDVTEPFWGLTYTHWGMFFIAATTVFSLWLLWRNRSKSNLFFVAALINTLVFMLSVRMHERYLFPTLALLAIAYIYRPSKKLVVLFVGWSLTMFVNCIEVVMGHMYEFTLEPDNSGLIVLSAVNMALMVYMIYTALTLYKKGETPEETPIAPAVSGWAAQPAAEASAPRIPVTRKDWLLIGGLMLCYAVIAFTNLGNIRSPQSQWVPSDGAAVVTLKDRALIYAVQVMPGPKFDPRFNLFYSEDKVNWTPAEVNFHPDMTVFAWHELSTFAHGKYLKIEPIEAEDAPVLEVAFRDEQSRQVHILEVEGAQGLFDEQALVPEGNALQNSTYFDEIYHARTGYEFVHPGLGSYETSHPPFGKLIISWGIRLFGMTPFGWRAMGVLFGILMIPFMFLFGKKMFGDSRWGFFTAFIFTFDFMHFTQTRIATIDVYVTFFVICMYYFMYLYTKMSFRDTPLWKTLIPLGLSGLCMGFGVASKWSGVYAGAGLAVIFFITLYRRYLEYIQARAQHDIETMKKYRRYTLITIGWCCVFFVLIPAVIYTLSYIPYIRGFGDGTPLVRGMLDSQELMYGYHANQRDTHPYSSYWWQWPLMIRPMFYYLHVVSDNWRASISAFGNPAIWWASIVCGAICLYSFLKKWNKDLAFLLIALAAQYLPWLMVMRSTYIYHFFPSVPFVVLMIAYVFKNYVKRKRLIVGYCVLVFLLFVLFYPVIAAAPIHLKVAPFLRWIPGWQFI